MTGYFDTNIIAYIENETLSISQIENNLGVKFTDIYYSASHIQEALEIKGVDEKQKNERINKRLRTIELITNSKYLFEDLNKNVFKLIENPSSVLETITEIPFGQDMMKNLLRLISEEQKEEARKQLGLEPSKLNNYSPQEVLEHLNKKLSETSPYSFLELIEFGISHHPNSKSFGLSNRIGGIFELLDMFGYWKDKYNEKSDYARMWDSSHAFFAAHCDYFVTDDKRTRNKANVVYNIYKIGTQVYSSKGK